MATKNRVPLRVGRALAAGGGWLVLLSLIVLSRTALATPAQWESDSRSAYGSSSAPCVPCHSNTFSRSTALDIPTVDVNSSATSASVSMSGVVSSRFLGWRFRPVGSNADGDFVLSSSTTVSGLSPGANQFEFCVVENTADTISSSGPTGLVSWNCDNFTVNRNRLPSASLSTGNSVVVDVGGSVTVTVNGSDDDNDNLTYTAASDDPGLASVSGPTGASGNTFSVTGVAAGGTSIDFRVTDSNNESVTVTLNVTINQGNRAPTLTINPSGSTTVTAGASVTLQSNGTDQDNDTLSYSASSSNTAAATVSGDNSTGNYTIATSASLSSATTVTITVTVSDGSLSDSETLTLNINPAPQPNRDPVLSLNSGANRTLAIDGSIDITASATDEDNDTLSFAAQSQNPSVVSVETISTTVFRLRGISAGSSAVVFTVDDGEGGDDSVTVTVTVEADPPPNQAPVISLDSGSSAQLSSGQTLTVQASATDAENDTVTFSAQSNNTAVASVAETGTGRYEITAGATAGSAQVTFTASDAGGSTSQTVTVTVTAAPNTAPVISLDSAASAQLSSGQTLTVQASATDAENDTVTFSAESNNTAVASVAETGNGRYIITAGATAGSAQVTFTASDAEDSSSTTVTVTVTAADNNPPVISLSSGPDAELDPGDTLTVQLSATDAENDTVTFSAASSDSTVASVAQANGNDYVVTANQAGSAQVTFTASDGEGSSSATVMVTVAAQGNQLPVISSVQPESLTLTLGGSGSFTINASDAEDGDNLQYTAVSDNTAVATVAQTSNAEMFQVTAGSSEGSATITVEVSDSADQRVSASVVVTVTSEPVENTAPVPGGLDTFSAGRGDTTLILDVLEGDTDAEDAAGLTISLASDVSENGASISVENNQVLYVVPDPFDAIDSFVYVVTDSADLSAMQTISVTPPDPDADGVFDAMDNCPDDANPADGSGSQLDTDNDGSGDICDPNADGDAELDGVLTLSVLQSGRSGRIIFPADDSVEVLANISAGTLTDTNFTIDWSASDGSINDATTTAAVNVCDAGSATQAMCGRLSLNPAGLAPGAHTVRAMAMVDGLPVSISADLLVLGTAVAAAQRESFSDADNDGFPALNDDDSASANPVNVVAGNNANQISAEALNRIGLGRYAALHWSRQNFAQTSVLLRFEQFLPASLGIHRMLTPSDNPPLVDGAGVFNFTIQSDASGGQMLRAIIHLPAAVPANPDLLIFQPLAPSGVWQRFGGSEDSVRAAAASAAGCPAFDDSSYSLAWGGSGASAAAAAGANCLQFAVRDGGVNDTDGRVNGVVSLVFNLGDEVVDCAGCDGLFIPVDSGREDLELNPSSGGGALGLSALAMLIGLLVLLFLRANMRITRAALSNGIGTRNRG